MFFLANTHCTFSLFHFLHKLQIQVIKLCMTLACNLQGAVTRLNWSSGSRIHFLFGFVIFYGRLQFLSDGRRLPSDGRKNGVMPTATH